MKSTFIILFLQLFSRLPFFTARWLGGQLGKLAVIFNTRNYRNTLTNLAICYPDMSEAERKSVAKSSLQETGKTALESLVIWRLKQKAVKLVVRVQNQHLLEEALADDRGLIVLNPHHGNWEMVGHYLLQHTELMCLYQPADTEQVDRFVKAGRSDPKMTLVPTDKRGVIQLIKTLKNGGVTGILPDQIPDQAASGEFAPFFGKPAFTMTLVHNLIQRSQCQTIVCSTKRVKGGFEIIFQKPDDDIYSEDALASLTALNQSVQNCIHNAPAEYSWEYKRFRVRSANTKAKAQGIEGVKY